jgi:hypothetical protein
MAFVSKSNWGRSGGRARLMANFLVISCRSREILHTFG